ncbi:hypothetical protein GH714_036587 [Hevea brasiliensis]|uniref:Uncharacterized protein n=1 Tax=Hevea brasiliensis TaxID=3981 RepID=A0A6A6KMG5_HEVBR|nr:hypothetical protein GH714_036587 [Hevea brasiliensis]
MADAATKHLSINGGTLVSDLKSLSSLLKTRRTVAFAYGFAFVFVAFTVFLAFNPSPNSSAPWFYNIFTSSSVATSSASDRSHFSSIFSYFFPNNSSPQKQAHDFSTLPPQNIPRSNTTLSQPSRTNDEVKGLPTVQNHTQNTDDSVQTSVLQANQSSNVSIVSEVPSAAENNAQNIQNSNKDQALKPNQTTVSPTIRPAPANHSANSSANPVSPVPANKVANSSTNSVPAAPAIQKANSSTTSASSAKGNSGKQEKGVAMKKEASNYTASLLKKEIMDRNRKMELIQRR